MDVNFEFVVRFWATLVATAARWFRKDEEKEAVAIAYGFHLWRNLTEDIDPGHLAYRACLAVQRGRDMPGVMTNNHQPDAMDHVWQGAGMGDAMDRSPGPDQIAEWRDEVRHLRTLASDDDRVMLDMLLDENTQVEIANRLRVQKHTITDRKQRLANRVK